MRRRDFLAGLLALLLSSPAWAHPPAPTQTVPVYRPDGSLQALERNTPTGRFIVWEAPNWTQPAPQPVIPYQAPKPEPPSFFKELQTPKRFR